MADIFDDVEKMVAAERNSEDTAAAEPVAEDSQSFNDSELEDIMAEIESLESDFESEELKSSPEVLAFDSSKAHKTDLQKQIESEIEKEIDMHANVAEVEAVEEPAAFTDEELAEIESSTDHIEMAKTPPVAAFVPRESKAKSEMSFEATGSMNVVLKFKIGAEVAELFIDQDRGLIVNMNGVELCLSENAGCTVTMENGINFNIPLTTSQSGPKKKAA